MARVSPCTRTTGTYGAVFGVFLAQSVLDDGVHTMSDPDDIATLFEMILNDFDLAGTIPSDDKAGYDVHRVIDGLVDADSFFDSPRRSALLPLGGQTAGHKGFALSLLVDVLAVILLSVSRSSMQPAHVDVDATTLPLESVGTLAS